MIKSDVLQYTRLDIKTIEFIFYLVKEYEELIVDYVVEELKVGPQCMPKLLWTGRPFRAPPM
jgi:hypothetical protein